MTENSYEEVYAIEHPVKKEANLISVDAFYDALHNEQEMGISDPMESVNNAIHNTPVADAVMVVHSFWEWNESYNACRCHECGSCFNGLMKHRFCPDCGAKMEKIMRLID